MSDFLDSEAEESDVSNFDAFHYYVIDYLGYNLIERPIFIAMNRLISL
jgi:hypothetical protein